MSYEKIQSDLNRLYQHSRMSYGMLVLELTPEQLPGLVEALKCECDFDLLLDITAIDFPERELRFELVYHLYSSKHNARLRLKLPVGENQAQVATLTKLYGSAHYLERETHEMYGIFFVGNEDLRPILLYEGFEGAPLRKDYPIDREQPLVRYRK